ncbi:MAG: O-antigen ligase family protein [Myxococcota bacterium]
MFDYLQYPYALLAAVALVLLLWRPIAGLIFVAAIFPMDPFSPRLPVPGLNTETVLLGLGFAMTVLRFGGRIPPLRYSGPVFAYIAVTGMAFALAIPWAIRFTMNGDAAIWAIFKFWKSVTFSALLFFATYWWFSQAADRQRMLEALSVGILISAVAGVADFVLGINAATAGRAAGLQVDPNDMGEAIGSMMFVPLYLATRGHELSRLRRLFHAGVYASAFLAMVLSLSRGNWVALVVAHAVYLLLVSRPLLFAGTASLLLLATIAFPLLPSVVRERIEGTFAVGANTQVYQVPYAVGLEGSAAIRIVFAKIGADMFMQSPLWGNGLNSFYFRTPEFGAKYGVLETKDPHNLAVKLAAESGLIGIGALTWLVWAVFRCGRRLWRADTREYGLGAVLLAAGTHVLIASLSADSFLSSKQVSAYFWILFALCARAYVERYSVEEAVATQPVVPRWRRFSQSTAAAASQS